MWEREKGKQEGKGREEERGGKGKGGKGRGGKTSRERIRTFKPNTWKGR